jgi:hypothetical protein
MGNDHKALHYRDHADATGYISLNYNEFLFFLKNGIIFLKKQVPKPIHVCKE